MADENIRLCRIVSDSLWKWSVALTGLRSACIISIECKYHNPFAASASFSHVLGLEDGR